MAYWLAVLVLTVFDKWSAALTDFWRLAVLTAGFQWLAALTNDMSLAELAVLTKKVVVLENPP